MLVYIFSFEALWQEAKSSKLQPKEQGTDEASMTLSAVELTVRLSVAVNILFTQIMCNMGSSTCSEASVYPWPRWTAVMGCRCGSCPRVLPRTATLKTES